MTKTNRTVLVAMSGGVDSSVAALLLKKRGFRVTGITMKFMPEEPRISHHRDAKNVASILDIPHLMVDASEDFKKTVIDKFCDEYIKGRTPNPCVCCNRYMKFNILQKAAEEQGVDFIATGHYARIAHDKKTGTYYLKKARNEQKDQSYFLYTLDQAILQRTLMPLGDLTKDEVRSIAKHNDLPVFQKEESQEICFVDGKNYRQLFTQCAGHTECAERTGCAGPGPIVNRDGNVLGTHTGIVDYTIGQRRGLGIATGKPLYVIDIDAAKNVIVVGSEDEAYHDRLIAEDVNWVTHPVKREIQVMAKIRSVHNAAKATLIPESNGRVELAFFEPQWGIAPGQSAVFYDHDTVIGGGIIERANRCRIKSTRQPGSQISS